MNTARQNPVPIMITEGSAILRERLCELVKERSGLEVVGPAATALEGWDLFLRHRPSAVLLDIKLRDGNGIELLRRIKLADPDCVVVVLSDYHEPEFEHECQRRGADFFLNKSSEFDQAVDLLARLPLRSRRPAASASSGPPGSPLAARVTAQFAPAADLVPGERPLHQTA